MLPSIDVLRNATELTRYDGKASKAKIQIAPQKLNSIDTRHTVFKLGKTSATNSSPFRTDFYSFKRKLKKEDGCTLKTSVTSAAPYTSGVTYTTE